MPGGSTIGSRLIFVANEKLIISIEKFVYLKKKSVDKFETIEMYDALGRKVLSSKIDKVATEYTFTVEGLSTGMYNIILNGSLGKATKKLIVD